MSTINQRRRPTKGAVVFSKRNKVGFVLALLLGLFDVPAVLQPEDAAETPIAVLALSTVCGLVTLVAIGWGWRRRSWPAIRVGAGARIVSLLLAIPAFFVEGLPGWLRIAVSAWVLLTILTVFLMLAPARGAGSEGAPR
jgi:peptidoglycan/LPS O-acetylase OafA/YrhL